ncbi:hypothetical protein J4H86_03350 [Spiractinospora alimapuensis]|uniref:hypothetical protein n=1 Tax=Spiractinospora alimapuensis TaxID=2820884 RepID=UPI001F19A58A|nr:hypothetical protein [Spiractinospora alimapuensis]QVQ52871.1 hypothetical protein J4H86_03350 [Spiractinospora alimapuensis]
MGALPPLSETNAASTRAMSTNTQPKKGVSLTTEAASSGAAQGISLVDGEAVDAVSTRAWPNVQAVSRPRTTLGTTRRVTAFRDRQDFRDRLLSRGDACRTPITQKRVHRGVLVERANTRGTQDLVIRQTSVALIHALRRATGQVP